MRRIATFLAGVFVTLLATNAPGLASSNSIARLDSLLSVMPGDVDLLLERCRALVRAGRWKEAATAAAAVAAAHPNDAEAWTVWADAERVGGNRAAARRVLERGLGRASESAELRARLARLDYQAGHVGDARRAMQHALASDPRVEGGISDLALYSPVVAETGYLHERLTNGDVWISRTLSASLRPRGAWAYVLESEAVRRPVGEDVALRATATHRLRSWEWAGGLQAAPGSKFVARDGAWLEATRIVDSRWSADLGLRTLGFADGRVQIAKAGLRRATGDWEAGFHLHAVLDAERDVEWTQVASGAWSRSARTSVTAQLFHGAEVIHPASSSDLRSVSTSGIALNGRFYLSDRWGFRLGVGYAERQDSYVRRSVAFGLVGHL